MAVFDGTWGACAMAQTVRFSSSSALERIADVAQATDRHRRQPFKVWIPESLTLRFKARIGPALFFGIGGYPAGPGVKC